jgi:hypothetical protein
LEAAEQNLIFVKQLQQFLIHVKTKYMKRIFLLALAAALTLGTFAADKGKSKGHKAKKAVKTEKVCPPNCPRTGCGKM